MSAYNKNKGTGLGVPRLYWLCTSIYIINNVVGVVIVKRGVGDDKEAPGKRMTEIMLVMR